jgi:hypothetical protein
VFRRAKEVFRKYQLFRHAPSKIFASPALDRKSLKNIRLKVRRIISFTGALMCLKPALVARSHESFLLLLSAFHFQKLVKHWDSKNGIAPDCTMTEDLNFLGCYAVSLSEQFPTFRLMFKIQAVKVGCFLSTVWALKTKTLPSFETLGNTRTETRRHVPKCTSVSHSNHHIA